MAQPNETNYTFTRDQLSSQLHGVIQMFIEYRDVHGRNEHQAQFPAVDEIFQGLDAERWMIEEGLGAKATLQILPDGDIGKPNSYSLDFSEWLRTVYTGVKLYRWQIEVINLFMKAVVGSGKSTLIDILAQYDFASTGRQARVIFPIKSDHDHTK